MSPSSHPKDAGLDPLAGYGPAGRWMIAVWAVYGPWLFGMATLAADAEGMRLIIAVLPAAPLGLVLVPAFGDAATWVVGIPLRSG